MEARQEILAQLDAILPVIEPDALKREFAGAIHKLKHPMADILAKVKGESLSARARAIGVSRQTMYVWAEERFRPTLKQAKAIAKLSGVPIEQIVNDGQEAKRDARKAAHRKTARVAGRTPKAPRPTRRRDPAKRRVVAGEGRTRKARTVRGGAGG